MAIVRIVRHTAPFCALLAMACNKQPGQTAGSNDPTPLSQGEKIAYVALQETPLHLKPTADREVVLQDRNNQVTLNRIANIHLGDSLIIVSPHGQWLEVITPKGATGFVNVQDIAETKSSCERTCLQDTPAYEQPESEQTSDIIAAGSLLIAQACDKAWVRVHLPSIGWRYVHADKLSAQSNDIGMSHLINAAKIAIASNDPYEANEALEEGRAKYPEHPLLDVLAEFGDFTAMQEQPVVPTGKQRNKAEKFQ